MLSFLKRLFTPCDDQIRMQLAWLQLKSCLLNVRSLYVIFTVCQLVPSVNEVRYELFRMKCSKVQQMSPAQDALQQHVLQVNYRSFVWMLCALCRICLVRTVTDGLLKLMKTVLAYMSAGIHSFLPRKHCWSL